MLICGQQLFRSLRTHQSSSDQMKILKDNSTQTTRVFPTTTRAVGIAYRLWLPFSINRIYSGFGDEGIVGKLFPSLHNYFKETKHIDIATGKGYLF